MIIGIGIDLVDQTRIETSIRRYGTRFLQRVFTDQEIARCQQYNFPVEHYAGKFAVKEAFMKAIGSGPLQQVYFKDIEVLNRDSGSPYILPHHHAARIIQELAANIIHVSLSHTSNMVVAIVILERPQNDVLT